MKEKPYIRNILPKYAKSLFYIQNEQNGTPYIVKRALKWKFLSLMDHSVISTQIFAKLPLNSK